MQVLVARMEQLWATVCQWQGYFQSKWNGWICLWADRWIPLFGMGWGGVQLAKVQGVAGEHRERVIDRFQRNCV